MGELTSAAANSRPTRARFLVLAWLCAAAALAYLSRNTISVAESTVRRDLGLTKQQSGWLMSGFFFSYALLSIPAAQIGQRTGSRRALPLFATVWSVATAATALVGGLGGFLAARIVQGIAQAGLFPTTTVIFFTSWFATYLQETRGISIAHSGFLNMLPLIVVVAAGMMGARCPTGCSNELPAATSRADG